MSKRIPISLEEKKKILVEILDAVHEYCEQNGICYYLTGGTLLGAVRHKGFIPWDDDIDIAMPRADYEKFTAHFNDGRNDKYRVISIDNTKGYYLPFAKVADMSTVLKEDISMPIEIGVNLDLFPLDYLPDDMEEAKKHNGKVGKWRKMLAVKNIKISSDRAFYKNAVLLFSKALAMPFSFKTVISKIENVSRKYNNLDNATHIANLVIMAYGNKEIMEKSYYDKVIKLPFENSEYNVPAEYDKVLTHLYGDYMQLPPEEKRVTHHACNAWRIEE